MNNYEINTTYNQMIQQEANYQNQLLYKRIENFIGNHIYTFFIILFIAILIRYLYDKKQIKKSNQERKTLQNEKQEDQE